MNWPVEETDILIIGSGIAGLSAALTAGQEAKVLVLTKGKIEESSTNQAQGGIAVAFQQSDSPQAHLEDTLAAGDGLCDPEAVGILVREGIDRVKELITWGTSFDKEGGDFAWGQEGAHRRRRILHAGDATGSEIARALGQRVRQTGAAQVRESINVCQLLMDNGRCRGAIAYDQKKNCWQIFTAQAVILATGGLGQLFEYTTNPGFATGEGVALAGAAGAPVADLEFVQFHPTTLAAGKSAEARKTVSVFLISEAVRGEGAILLNAKKERFMPRYHPMAELAPRDVVARAIIKEMNKDKSDSVWLDLSHLPAHFIQKRFPNIYSRCLELGFDMAKGSIPVAPAAHYAMGGVVTDLTGKTSRPGLLAAGEVACVGVHGANRLASNSLLDGLVFGHRAARSALLYIKERSQTEAPAPASPPTAPAAGPEIKIGQPFEVSGEAAKLSLAIQDQIKRLMWAKVGINRQGEKLREAIKELDKLEQDLRQAGPWPDQAEPGKIEPAGLVASPSAVDLLETLGQIKTARLIAAAALWREESRGAHWRDDFPYTDDKKFLKHHIVSLARE